ncbi:MAG: DUF4831 family protein [Bacteroidales bacterium]|nr:DUF4831 family protein [Bacteroidales bacterium]
MKYRTILLLIACAMVAASCSYEVRTVRSKPKMSSPGGLLYALPRTEICVDVTIGHYDTVGAPFVKFASEMLSTNGTMEGYEIRSVKMSTRVVADPMQFYYVRPRGMMVQVDSRNLLRSVGLTTSDLSDANEAATADIEDDNEQHLSPQYNLYDRADTFYTRSDRPGKPTLVASKKDTRSLRQQAIVAAERIGQLQERRQQLLNGESETSYTPEGMRVVLELIDNQERQLQEQFLGRYTTETVRFTYIPRDEKTLIDSQTVVLFCFNPQKGFCDTSDAKAMPVYLSLRCDNTMRNAARFVKFRVGTFQKGNMNDRNTFKYRSSEQADVTLYCPLFSIEKQLPIAQFGPTMELPYGKIKALFDAHTGDLIYMAN